MLSPQGAVSVLRRPLLKSEKWRTRLFPPHFPWSVGWLITENESLYRTKALFDLCGLPQDSNQLFIILGCHVHTVFCCHLRFTVERCSIETVFIVFTVFVFPTLPLSKGNFPNQVHSLLLFGIINLGVPHQHDKSNGWL